ncbi:MAG: hypothetical protein AMXMBFR42_21740 [Burkholderiales bacterium]
MMAARKPEDVHALFGRHFAAGDMDALLSLYEPTAILVPQPGKVARGPSAIRESLSAFLAMKGTFRFESIRTLQADDIAVVFARWTLDAKAPDGSPIHLAGETSDVIRRQPDGCWLLAIDSPFGSAGAP